MPAASRAVTVATTATRIDADDRVSATQGLSLFNNGAATVYIGGSGVTTATGYPLAEGEHLAVDLAQADLLYGIVASGTVEVRVFEVGV